MHVFREVLLEGVPEVLVQVEGWLEGAEALVSDLPDKGCEDLQDLGWGAGDKHTEGCATQELGLLCGEPRNQRQGCVRASLQSPSNGVRPD